MQGRTVYLMGKESVRNIRLSRRFWEILTKSGNGWKTEKRSSGKNSDEVKIIEIKNAIILRKMMILRVMAFLCAVYICGSRGDNIGIPGFRRIECDLYGTST